MVTTGELVILQKRTGDDDDHDPPDDDDRDVILLPNAERYDQCYDYHHTAIKRPSRQQGCTDLVSPLSLLSQRLNKKILPSPTVPFSEPLGLPGVRVE